MDTLRSCLERDPLERGKIGGDDGLLSHPYLHRRGRKRCLGPSCGNSSPSTGAVVRPAATVVTSSHGTTESAAASFRGIS